jgi:cysteine desulfuration protein SufE
MHPSYPAALQELITFFESLPEGERRENLIELAAQAPNHAPKPGEAFDLDDVRHDPECTDKVGVHLRLESGSRAHFALSFGPKVQTLTRALGVILCRGLNGTTLEEVQAVSEDFVPRLIGAELVRLRSQTVYYVLKRMKEAAAKLPAGNGESAGVSSDALMVVQPS